MKNIIESLALLSGLLAHGAMAQKPVTGLPKQAKCWAQPYTTQQISKTASLTYNLHIATVHEFPMAYPVSNMIYPKWERNGAHFPTHGAPWAPGCDTSRMQKYPLVPANLAGPDGAWDGTKSRSSDVGNGHTQSDFVFVDAKRAFCMIATETPWGVDGWLPCWWQ